MQLTRWLSSAFHVEQGEGRLVGLLLLECFFLGAAFNFTQTAAFSLFLVEFNARTLPWVYIANALIVPAIGFATLKLGDRLGFVRLLVANIVFLIILVTATWAGLAATGSRLLILALPIVFQLLINVGNVSFWTLVARLLNVQQGKRLFGLVGSGQWMAILVTGFLMPGLVGLVGTSNLLLLAAAGLAGMLATMLVTTRRFAPHLAASGTAVAGPRSEHSPLGPVVRERYVASLLVLVLLCWIAFFFVDNLFYAQAAAAYPRAEDLAGFLGIFLGLLGAVTLVANLFVTGRVIGRFGVRASLLALPAGLLAFAAATAALGTAGGAATLLFWPVMASKLLDVSAGLSLDRSAQTILTQPLPPRERGQVQTVTEAVMLPLANGVAGVVLLVLNALFGGQTLPLIYGLVVVAAAWLGVALALGGQYPARLVRSLRGRRLTGAGFAVADPVSVAVLRAGLANPHPGASLYSASLLEQVEPESVAGWLPALLDHPSPDVRRHGLERLERLEVRAALPAIRQLAAREDSPAVLGTALRVLATLGEARDRAAVAGYVDDAAVDIRVGAIVGTLRSGEDAGAVPSRLASMVRSPDRDERALAAHIAGEAKLATLDPVLAELLGDPSPAIRRAALRAAGQVKSAPLWPRVVAALDTPEVAGAAAAALVGGGEAVLPELAKAWADQPAPEVAARLARICGRIGGPTAVAVLRDRLESADPDVRGEVLRALSRCGYAARNGDGAPVRRQIASEAASAARLLAASAGLGDDASSPAVALLKAALDGQVAEARERVFLLVSFICDAYSVRRAHDNLAQSSPERRAYALEVFEVLLPQDVKSIALPVLDVLSPGERLRRLSAYFPQPTLTRQQWLHELQPARAAVGLSRWTTACACYAAPGSQNGDGAMLSTIEKVLILKTVSIFAETPDPVLADVARTLEEVEVYTGQSIFEKGEAGDSMYVVAGGQVRVHDAGRTLNLLGPGDVFGEMAILDPQPRVASVTAIDDTLLLRLDQEALEELMDDRVEVARGIIRVLSRRLRDRVQDLAALTAPAAGSAAR